MQKGNSLFFDIDETKRCRRRWDYGKETRPDGGRRHQDLTRSLKLNAMIQINPRVMI